MVLVSALDAGNRHAFLQPSCDIYESALDQAKRALDGVAAGICDEYAVSRAGKRKRQGYDETWPALKIRMIHTDGFGVKQIWEQARRIIDGARLEVERALEDSSISGDNDGGDESDQAGGIFNATNSQEDGSGSDHDDVSVDEGEAAGGRSDMSYMETSRSSSSLPSLDEDLEDSIYDTGGVGDVDSGNKTTEVFVEDPNGLNDGFFSIDEFNKQTEFLEQQDAAGDPFTGEASDEEEIDWDADPMSLPIPKAPISKRAAPAYNGVGVSRNGPGGEDEEDQGPTFGNVDLNVAEGESDDGDGGSLDPEALEIRENTNDVLYKDFFQPPPPRARKDEHHAKFSKRKTPTLSEFQEIDIERTMAGVRRDLFEENSQKEDSEDALPAADPSDPKSTHERQQARLVAEIRRLEAASITKREWTLAGEARAADRPINSLLEEDLDFERTGKPVPLITAEISESIEDLIKRRILAQEFDEVIRRRPGSESIPANVRRGAFELDDTKPQQSLAEIYEEEHMKNTNPDAYMSKADDKLKNQHQEIEILWKEVSTKLDALSNWHYKPRPPVPSLTVVADVATVSMEDAQPTTATGLAGGTSMLAPQEIYKPGEDKSAIEKGEIVLKSGVPVARQEMTREEKIRRRRREKERMKKASELPKKLDSKSKKRELISELRKGGVKVIGKKGELKDIGGKKLKAAPAVKGVGGFKL